MKIWFKKLKIEILPLTLNFNFILNYSAFKTWLYGFIVHYTHFCYITATY